MVDREAVVALTRELVAIPSVNRPADGLSEQPAAERVAAEMRRLGWEPHVWEVSPGRPNVLATIEGDRPGPTLLFEGHTDVVSEGDPARWSFDPFAGDLVDGVVRGRGAADMKGGVAAMIHAAAAVTAGGGFPGTVKVAALCDEEGLMLGVKDFVARGHADDVDGAIVCEPEGGEVCATQKGALRVRVTARGTMAHGAMPHEGRNPVTALARLVARLERLEEVLADDPGPDPHLGLTYLTPTVVHGGELAQLNVIPERAELAVDVRTVPALPNGDVVGLIAAEASAVADETGVGLDVEVLEDRPATATSPRDPVVQAVREAHTDVTGAAPVLGGVPGATDGTILWRDAGLPVVVYGPGEKWIAHQVDERVAVDDLVTCAQVYVEAARRFLSRDE